MTRTMTRTLLITAALAAAASLSACGGTNAPFAFGPATPTGSGNVSPVGSPGPWYTPSGTRYDPSPCRGPAQLAKSPCPTINYPYARDVTVGDGRS